VVTVQDFPISSGLSLVLYQDPAQKKQKKNIILKNFPDGLRVIRF